MNIAIVDDLEQDRARIEELLLQYLDDSHIQAEVSSFGSGEEFLAAHEPGRFELLLLDLYMGGMSGMDVARKVRELGDRCQLVFVTTSSDCAVSSYEVEAGGYLLKPVDAPSLERTLSRCLKRMDNAPKYIEVTANRIPTRVFLNTILWVDTYQNAIFFHTDNGVLKTYMTFGQISRMLEGEKRFLPCYKGCLVNMDRVAAIEGDDFRMESGDLVQIRKRGSNQVKQAYVQYMCDRNLT